MTLSDGATYFELVGQEYTFLQQPSTIAAHQFEVRLKQNYITLESTYNYEVSALALGGARAAQQSSMTVTPPEYDCSSATLRSLQNTYEFDIPKPEQQIERLILSGFADYISSPVVGCTQVYSLEMRDGSNVPSYYEIDNFGSIKITIDGDYPLISDEILVVISSTDNVSSNYVQRTSSFFVVTKCGPGSTDVIAPA